MASNINIVVGCSQAFKDALGVFAEHNNASSNSIARQAIAAYIGFDLATEQANKVETRGRPRKYTEQERKEKAREKARNDRKAATTLLNAFRQQEAKRDMEKFRQSVEKQYGPIV